MTDKLGVGFIGAGPVTQAIHLPTLALLADDFAVTAVMDIDPAIADAVAGRCGGWGTTSSEAVLDDPDTDVVAVCSPHDLHAEHVIAACEAGKKAVLCEKPLAMSVADADRIEEAVRQSGVPLIVGAMHTFDPGWLAAETEIRALSGRAHTVRYSIVLPPNARFEDFAANVITRPARGGAWAPDADAAANAVFGGVMGLAIHDLPLVRRFCPEFASAEVLSARPRRPGGYLINLRAGSVHAQITAVTTGTTWAPEWIFEAFDDETHLRTEFPPSYVHAGSAITTVTSSGRSTVYGPFDINGYENEWRHLRDVVRGVVSAPDVRGVVDDVVFALRIASDSAGLIRRDLHGSEARKA